MGHRESAPIITGDNVLRRGAVFDVHRRPEALTPFAALKAESQRVMIFFFERR